MHVRHWMLALVVILVSLSPWACDSKATPGDGGPECMTAEDCKGDKFCVGGACVDCRNDVDCAANEVCMGGECLTACPEEDRCERGGDCCPGDWECIEASCFPPCDGVRCGHMNELCCGSEQVCEEQRCLVDCGARARCGAAMDQCCRSGEICYGAKCTEPQGECVLQSDCPDGFVCERDLGLCIAEEVIGDCLYHPPVGQFTPAVECRWTPDPTGPNTGRRDVVMAPVVANLTDDNGDGKTDTFDVPDLAFVSYNLDDDGCCNQDGTLRIVSGRCNPDGSATTIASFNNPALDNSGGLAVGDLDGDGVPEIVGVLNNCGNPQGAIALKRDSPDGASWSALWINTDYPTWNVHTRGASQPALADLTGDGLPEVVIGNVVLNHADGSLLWDGLVSSGGSGGIGNNAFLGPVSTVADIDLDGEPEVLAGNTCYGPDGTVKWTFDYTTSNSPCGGQLPCDGYTATGNFDLDPQGEVVIVRQGEVFVIGHDGALQAKVAIPTDDCANNESGPPTVADFDGDRRPEIGTAAADFYVVVDLDCDVDPVPEGCRSRGVLWAVPNNDCSSRVTSSSVFDFEGDGKAEVIYADETNFRIFDGSTGAVLYDDASHRSHTRLEMPVIADVDNDGNAEVVIAENGYNGGQAGVVIWGDRSDNWVFTRRIWNQHSYHVTNVTEEGTVPADETVNWSQDHLNNFRQNVQGEGLFYAPDLLVLNLHAVCETPTRVLFAFDVVNQGSRMVPDGVAVALYVDDRAVEVIRTTKPLLPGEFEHVGLSWDIPAELQNTSFSARVQADDLGDGTGEHNECEGGGEDNNGADLALVGCGSVD